MENEIKWKNILDLQFQKYLAASSTTRIIVFTYFVGISIAILTKQLDLSDFKIMPILLIISSAVLGMCAILFFNARFHIENIPKVIKTFK